jgi:hypothetical protein
MLREMARQHLKGSLIVEEKGTSIDAEVLTVLRITLYYSHAVLTSV